MRTRWRRPSSISCRSAAWYTPRRDGRPAHPETARREQLLAPHRPRARMALPAHGRSDRPPRRRAEEPAVDDDRPPFRRAPHGPADVHGGRQPLRASRVERRLRPPPGVVAEPATHAARDDPGRRPDPRGRRAPSGGRGAWGPLAEAEGDESVLRAVRADHGAGYPGRGARASVLTRTAGRVSAAPPDGRIAVVRTCR